MLHPSDERWALRAPSAPRTINVIDPHPHAINWRERYLHDTGRTVELVPFGFARELLRDPDTGAPICGHPARRRNWGGCDLRHGHPGAHRYNPRSPKAIRPGAEHASQGAGTEAPSGPPASDANAARIAELEAEVERLKDERALEDGAETA